MASTYSNLKIQLMATGENTTTWGDITNINIGAALGAAIAGSVNIAFTSADKTLTWTNDNGPQDARYVRLNLTGAATSGYNLILPVVTGGKPYIVNNGTDGTITVKNTTGTGIAVPAGKTMWVYNDGTNVVDVSTHLTSLSTTGDLAVGANATFGAVITTGTNTSTGDCRIEVGASRSDVGAAYIDLHAQAGQDYNSRIIRTAGANGNMDIFNVGTGEMGINQVGAGPLILRTTSTERMRIDSAGLVGVGASAPKTKFQVTAGGYLNAPVLGSATGAPLYVTNADSSYGLVVGINSADGRAWFQAQRTDGTASSGPITLNEAGGNVGVGTASPTFKLVAANNTFDGVGMGSSSTYSLITLGGYFSSTAGAAQIGYERSTGAFVFGNGTRDAPTEMMRITSAGLVGIGTTSPTTKLTISGGAATTATGQLLVKDPNYSGVALVQGGVGEGYLWNITNNFLSIGTNNTERMRVLAGGNVGIGTATPSTALEVVGTVTATAFTGTASNATNLNGQAASYYTDIPARLGYTPVQQGGGAGQGSSKLYIGWLGASLGLQVDATNFGATWPIGITGNAATATTATTANALNTGLAYQINGLGVGVNPSGTAGEIRATNNVTAFFSSDAKLKENVQPIQNALGIVSAVGGKTFDWTDEYIAERGGEDGYFVRKSDFGVIAQDVQTVFPAAVRKREDGTLAVDYEKLVAVAFQAIAELRAEVEALKK